MGYTMYCTYQLIFYIIGGIEIMNNSNASQRPERKPFKIELSEFAEFKGMATTMFISSNELGKLVSDLFHDIFADFEGCIFEIPQNSQLPPYYSLIFNHGDYDDKAIVACERANGAKNSDNDVLARIRYRDAQLTNGDRFILNEDGKDAIKPLLLHRIFNNGNPNWKTITGDFTEGNQGLYGYQGRQYTKVSFIDPDRLCSLLYGSKDGDSNVDYHVSIFGPMNNFAGQMSSNFMLSVIRVSEKEVGSTYEKLGLASTSRIIK